jgi:hypothetical protein
MSWRSRRLIISRSMSFQSTVIVRYLRVLISSLIK